MINLLPPEEKQKIFLDRKRKLAVIFGIVLLTSMVCLTLVLISIKFCILTLMDSQKNMLAQSQQKYQNTELANLKEVIQKYNTELVQLDSFYKNEIYFGGVLDIISDFQSNKALYLTNYSLVRNLDAKIKVSIAGVSSSREDLLAFKKTIEADEKIKNVYFSPESWTNPKNAIFSLTFEISKNEKQ